MEKVEKVDPNVDLGKVDPNAPAVKLKDYVTEKVDPNAPVVKLG